MSGALPDPGLIVILTGGLVAVFALNEARHHLHQRWQARHTRPPVPGNAATPPAAAPAYPDGQTPAPGHHRGNNMVIDTWECGCIYTWTRAAGWAHDFDCLDAELRKLLTPPPDREVWDT